MGEEVPFSQFPQPGCSSLSSIAGESLDVNLTNAAVSQQLIISIDISSQSNGGLWDGAKGRGDA